MYLWIIQEYVQKYLVNYINVCYNASQTQYELIVDSFAVEPIENMVCPHPDLPPPHSPTDWPPPVVMRASGLLLSFTPGNSSALRPLSATRRLVEVVNDY